MKRLGTGLVLSMIAALVAAIWAASLLKISNPNPWVENVVVFAAAKIAGDISRLFNRSASTFFYEDFFRETIVYIVGGLISAAAGIWAAAVIGGPVTPVVPAFGMHAAYVLGGRRPREQGWVE